MGWLKCRLKKNKNRVTILFVDWPREKPENKKRFEDVTKKKERKKEKLAVGETRHQKKKSKKN